MPRIGRSEEGHGSAGTASVAAFLELGPVKVRLAYRGLRNRRAFVETLRTWIDASRQEPASWRAWQSLRGQVEEFEEELSLSTGVNRNEHLRFLVETALDIAVGRQSSSERDAARTMLEPDGRQLLVAAKTLRNTPLLGTAMVPVALEHKNEGYLANLQVVAFTEGPRITANHPEQVLEYRFTDKIRGSLDDAFVAASEHAGKDLSGWWRLLPWPGEKPFPRDTIDGPSLSAAAARAWTLLLLQKKVDRRVLAIAKATKSAAIEALGNEAAMRAKVTRVCEMLKAVETHHPDSIDTIVVVGEVDRESARSAIKTAGMENRLRVIDLSEGGQAETVAAVPAA